MRDDPLLTNYNPMNIYIFQFPCGFPASILSSTWLSFPLPTITCFSDEGKNSKSLSATCYQQIIIPWTYSNFESRTFSGSWPWLFWGHFIFLLRFSTITIQICSNKTPGTKTKLQGCNIFILLNRMIYFSNVVVNQCFKQT